MNGTKNRWMTWYLLAVMVFPMTGCASVQKKFTRKPKEPKHIPAANYFEEGPYQKKYSNAYYYKMHYTLWKSCHEDLTRGTADGNRKKTERNYEDALNHLMEMRTYLVAEKQKELEPMLNELTELTKKFETGGYSKSEESSTRAELEKIKRFVSSNFYYNKIAGQILPNKINLSVVPPSPNPNPSPTAESPKAP